MKKSEILDLLELPKSYKLLSPPGANPKIAKNGVPTYALHLAPGNLSGYEVCPQRSPSCTELCIHWQGNPAFRKMKEKRIDRTWLFFEERKLFLALLRAEIKGALSSHGMACAFRLNATSDIPWEIYEVIQEFPQATFYDYTKVFRRMYQIMPSNYTLVFSRMEDNTKQTYQCIQDGKSVAVVFSKKKKAEVLAEGTYLGAPVVDGDEDDFLPRHPKGSVIALTAKGTAKKDTTGFVVT